MFFRKLNMDDPYLYLSFYNILKCSYSAQLIVYEVKCNLYIPTFFTIFLCIKSQNIMLIQSWVNIIYYIIYVYYITLKSGIFVMLNVIYIYILPGVLYRYCSYLCPTVFFVLSIYYLHMYCVVKK